MIWTIDTVDLMEKYTKRKYKSIQKTNYVIIGTRILITKERDNVLQAANFFIQSGILKGVGISTDPDSFIARERFKSFLLKTPKTLTLLCAIIECSLLEGEDTLLICSPNEMKCRYMDIIADVVMDLFHYPISRYPDTKEFDLEDVIKRLLYYKESIKKKQIKDASDVERIKMLEKMTKKELIKELKKRNLYHKNFDKDEMIEMLAEFY